MQDFSIWKNVFIPVVSIISTFLAIFMAIFKFWLKKKILQSIKDEIQLIEKHRTTFSQLLDLWSERIIGEHHMDDTWLKRFAKASKDVLLWCPDDILYHYALYIQEFKPDGSSEQRKHFTDTILKFRKIIGYKNYRGKITSEHILKIFSAGNPTNT